MIPMEKLPEEARVINALFKDVGLYVDEKGTLFTKEGRPVGKATGLFEFPREYKPLSKEKADALKKYGIVRVQTLREFIQLAPDGEYRVYDIQQVRPLEGLAALRKSVIIKKGLSTVLLAIREKDKKGKK